MKKKGLIISTVVMVVILIASLTTATYAWFSSTVTASVGNIAVNVGATSSVQIGIYDSTKSDTTAQANYRNGDVTYNPTTKTWDNGAIGLGSSVNTGLTLAVNAAVGSGTEVDTKWVMDETYNPENTLCTGSGATFDEVKDKATPAIINGAKGTGDEVITNVDVVDLNLGIRAIAEDLKGTFCKITVTPNDLIMGMIAALRFEITVGSKTYGGDIFGTTSWSDNAQETVFWFLIDEAAADANVTANTITNFQIRFFISGYDSDCCNDAINTSATIAMEFDGFTATAPEGSEGWTKLELTVA